MNRKVTANLLFAAVILTVIAVVIIVGLTKTDPEEVIQGETDATDYRVSSKVPGRIAEIRFQEGDRVKKGDTLAILEAPDIMAKLSQANAAYSAAKAIEEKAQNGARQEQKQAAFEMWQKAKAGLEVAKKTYERAENLFKEGVIAAQKRDEAKAQYDAMAATEKAAKAQYDMAENGAQKEDKAAARAQVERAKGAVSEVSSYIDEMVLIASADGEITEIYPEIGELVGTGSPIMNISKTDDYWFVFSVREDYLPGIKINDQKKVFIPALNKEVDVKITRMKNVGNFAAWKATKALDKYDLKTFEIQAKPLNQNEVDGLCIGMSAILK
ncbi:MAG: biotin/lipoyl-binding protein [Bacteroidales bacterium]|jgi:HlyD family secretion protein|nr:biotin/lipoyl-binding protein [Bacteroidales bacterium]MBR6278379.1 biotin/lipoyl-binding protein [Bacteroidales bacterium]